MTCVNRTAFTLLALQRFKTVARISRNSSSRVRVLSGELEYVALYIQYCTYSSVALHRSPQLVTMFGAQLLASADRLEVSPTE